MDTSIAQQSSRTTDASVKPRGGLLAALRKPATGSSDSSAESEGDASDSDRDAPAQSSRVRSPRRKQEQLSSHSASDLEEDNDELAAYERMKKRLAASKAITETDTATSIESNAPATATAISSEDEDDMPVKKIMRRPTARYAQRSSPLQSPVASPRSRQSSPGLFVTPNASPEKPRAATTVDSESEDASQNADLQTRVRRIRAERLARKKQEEEQAQRDESKSSRRRGQQESGSDSDGESGRRLTQQAKPTRKAGKKAMELMARDQQRISRNMQLTHQAKTKKKYGLDQLFSRFAYSAPDSEKPVNNGLPTPDASSNLASSDAEVNQAQDTPPTSPPMQAEPPATDAKESCDNEIATNTPPIALDKGKGRAPEFQHLPPRAWEQNVPVVVQNAQLGAQVSVDQAMVELSDSEDELNVVQPKSRFPVFDQIPLKKQQEPQAALRLRYLAQLNAGHEPRKNAKSMTKTQLDQLLARNSREQGRQERAEKLADLRRRGIYIETEEEREKNQMEIEDMVAQFEKQRQEDLKLAKAEREEAKKNGETIDELPSSDESDGDYVGSGDDDTNEVEDAAEEEEEAEIELSGSEDEEIEKDDESNALIATEADEASDSSEQQDDEDADMEDEISGAPARNRTTTRPRNIIVDEEDESDNEPAVSASATQQPSQNDDMAAFGFGNANVGLGLTQMFAGTMANLESGTQSQSAAAETEENSLDFLRNLPDTQPGVNFSQVSDSMVPNSQSLISPQKSSQTGLENQFSLGISQLVETSPAFSHTQLEDLPEPTQDAGFSFSRSPACLMPPPSTVDTVMMSIAESPIKQRKGKLQRRRQEAPVELSDEEEQLDVETVLSEEDDIQRPPKPRDAFAKLQKGAKKQKAADDFNKKTSLAKDAFMEQAEESEDEYAGLGGASDDDSGDEDEDTKNMIEHGEVDVDERQIAAFYA